MAGTSRQDRETSERLQLSADNPGTQLGGHTWHPGSGTGSGAPFPPAAAAPLLLFPYKPLHQPHLKELSQQ